MVQSFKDWCSSGDKDDLSEQAQAVVGDLEDYEVNDYDNSRTLDQKYKAVYIISETGLTTQWKLVGNISNRNNNIFDVYVNIHMDSSYIVVDRNFFYENEDKSAVRYNVVTKLQLDKQQSIGSAFGINNLYRVMEVITVPNMRSFGITKNLYKFLVKTLELHILGDSEQYFGARKLWARLSKDSDIIVDVVDVNTKQYIETNTTIHHGELDGDFDERIWSREEDKLHIRTLLKDIR